MHANATLLTSLYEGYPNVLIESIAMNTPVVSFDCPGGPREIVKDGVNGYLAKHLDVNDFKKILNLLQTKFNYKDLWNEMKDIKKVYKQYEDLINFFI